MSTIPRVAAATLLLAALPAQLPDWASLGLSSPPVRTFLEAHIVVVQEANAVHAFSTLTRRWTTQPTTSPTAQFHGYDDHCVVQDGSTFYGYASRHGVFAPLTVTSPSPVVPSLAASSFLTVVVDGPDVHAFSPFTGRWSTLRTNNASQISAAKLAAVFSDGPLVYGYSPLWGDFVPLQAPNAIVTAAAGGYCAHATDGTNHYAFSGVRNEWTTLPSAAGANVTIGTGRHGALVLVDGLDVDLFSGITGQNTRIACTQPPTITRAEQTVVVEDGVFTHVWSAITSTTAFVVTATPPVITVNNYYALLQDGQALHTFSAPQGTFAPVLQGGWSLVTSLGTALATDAQGATMAYSPLHNSWVAGPTGTALVPTVTQGSVALLDPAGTLHGFSVRTGTWASTPVATVDQTFTFGSNFCARAGTELYAFNERFGRWSHTTTPVPATVILHQQAIVASWGNAAVAYSVWNDRWSAETFAAPPTSVQVSDECGFVQTATRMHGFGGSAQVSTWALYPEWWRFMTRGTPCPIHVAGEPGAGAILGVGFDTAAHTFPGIAGQLGIAPTNSTALFGILPNQGTWVVPLQIPDLQGLVGVTFHVQALVLAPTGPYFTSVYPTTIL